MDADYLKKNVNDALTEALASMAVGMPEDKVEYMGRYLKSYVQRQRIKSKLEEEAGDAESKWAEIEVVNEAKKAEAAAAAAAENARAEKLTNFLSGLESANSKQDAMDQVAEFTAEYMDVPACYVGTRKMINEVDTLYYYAANASQASKVVGQKLTVSAEEGDDAPQRQGVSFDAFKVPEVPEVEPPEDAPEGWAPPPPPGPQPLVIDSCMRDTRVKFYGIPKLGSFLALPLIYQSSDHTEGIVEGEAPAEPVAAEETEAPADGEEGEPPAPVEPKKIWLPQKTVQQSMLLCLDTVGKYKAIKQTDIDTVKIIGDKLINVFELLETRQFEGQGVYLDGAKDFGPEKIAEYMAPIADEEAAALAAVADELTPPEAAEGDDAAPAPAVPETLKAFKEACAVLKVNTNSLMNEETFAPLVAGVSGHVLPPSTAVTNLIYTLALLTGCGADAKDIYGEITWNNLINKCVPSLSAGITSFDGESFDVTETKTFVEANGVLPGEYPPSCAICTALAQWATKAIGAADASAAHKAFLVEQEAAANAVEEE